MSGFMHMCIHYGFVYTNICEICDVCDVCVIWFILGK